MLDNHAEESALGPAVQDLYPDDPAQCCGCGRRNEHGLHIWSRWEGEETVAVYTPREHHTAIPGFVFGSLAPSPHGAT